MQAVTAETFGMAEPQRRKASPAHICWASALKAKLVVEAAQRLAPKATVSAARKTVFCEIEITTRPLCCPTLWLTGIGFRSLSRQNEMASWLGKMVSSLLVDETSSRNRDRLKEGA
jgi:hypothetical protein